MKWTNDDISLVEKFIDIKNRGYYANGGELTAVYNRVLEKNVASTNCGTCIRQRINELEVALKQYKKLVDLSTIELSAKSIEVVSEASEAVSEVEVDNVPQEENKAKRGVRKKK